MSNPYPLDGYDYYQMIEYAGCDQETYQQDIVIHRTTGTAYEETVGSLRIWHIYVGDHCREDYGDIRFTNSTGAELAYYLWPDYDAESARFCVRLEGADQSGALTVWYGNPTATTTSDGDAVYFFFDQFDGTSIDTAKWDATTYRYGGSISVSGSTARLVSTSSTNPTLVSKNRINTANVTIESKIRANSVSPVGQDIGICLRQNVLNRAYAVYFLYNSRDYSDAYIDVTGDGNYDYSKKFLRWKLGNWYTLRVSFYSGGVLWERAGESTAYGQTYFRDVYLYHGPWDVGNSMRAYDVEVDYTLVRAHSATPPAALTFSGERETAPPPFTAFAATPHVGPAPLTVQFTDQSTGAPTSWLWDFGDGYSSTEQHPIHIYETPGIYTVTLTVRNEHGAYRGIREGYITVGRPPATRYALSIYEIQAGRLPGWGYEPIMLTIPAGSVTGVLEDFPVMVKLSSASGANHADVTKVFAALGSDANRKRICITASDGLTPCYVEIKEWSTATQTAYLWVRVPRIDPGLDTHLYLYYDPLHAEMTRYVGDTGEPAAQQVWTNGYAGVWHKPSGSTLLDSTANANHGTIYGATETTGPLGRCLSFDGVDDYVDCGNDESLDPGTDDFSIEVVAKANSGITRRGIVNKGGWDAFGFSIQQPTNPANQYYFVVHPVGEGYKSVALALYETWGWTHIVARKTTDQFDAIINGTVRRGPTLLSTGSSVSNTRPLVFGKGTEGQCLNGEIAIITLSSVARSPAWIAATNLSLRDDLIVYSDPGAPLTLAAYVDAYDYLSWTRRYRRPGAWKAQINRYLPAAKEFVPGRLVHFKRNGEDRLGLIETRQISVDTSGRPSEQWTVAGREIIGILGDRLCLHGVSTGTGYDEQTGPAETVMRHYVNINAINPADYTRIVPFLSLAPVDDGRGGTTKQSARFDVLADLLESICAVSGLGYRGRWSWDDRRLYFEVLQGADRSDSVKLSPALGNCTIKGYNESTGLAPSVAVVAGQGEAAARVVVEVGTVEGLIGLARRERFIDARDLATEAELQQRGAEKLAEDGDTTTLEVEYIRTASYRYGEDFDLGDIVHVEYPDIAAMDARIVAITEEYAREGERLTLVLGTEWPDLTSVLRLAQKDNVVKRV